jgi:hypothetical protein
VVEGFISGVPSSGASVSMVMLPHFPPWNSR